MAILMALLVLGIVALASASHIRKPRPLTIAEEALIRRKFNEAFQNLEPRPKLNLTMHHKTRYPRFLSVDQGYRELVTLTWPNGSRKPRLQKVHRDARHQQAITNFLTHFGIRHRG